MYRVVAGSYRHCTGHLPTIYSIKCHPKTHASTKEVYEYSQLVKMNEDSYKIPISERVRSESQLNERECTIGEIRAEMTE